MGATAVEGASGGEWQPPKQQILIVCHPLMGHISPMLRIASYLTRQPYSVYFLGPTAHQERIEQTGASFLPLLDTADLDDQAYYASPPSSTPATPTAANGAEGQDYASLPWYERFLIDVREQCLNPLPDGWRSFLSALKTIYEGSRLFNEDSKSSVVVIAEAMFHGILPLFFDAPIPWLPSSSSCQPPWLKSICVSVTVPAIHNLDCPPLGYPVSPPYVPTPEGRARHARLWERSWAGKRALPLTQLLDQKLAEAGARRRLRRESSKPTSQSGEDHEHDDLAQGPEEILFGGLNYTYHQSILQLGVPGLEYPRSHWPPGFRFAGFVQGTSHKTTQKQQLLQQQQEQLADFPPWWPDILANSALDLKDPRRKKVVVVAQGTVETNPRDLILPTISAFSSSSRPQPIEYDDSRANAVLGNNRDRLPNEKVLVVAILGWKNATLHPFYSSSSSSPLSTATTPDNPPQLPANILVADFLSYDAILAHADVWVHNAGFGAVCHGIANGVPMVVAGEGMDTGENARRVAWSGIGVDLACGSRASAGDVRAAVVKVIMGDGDSDSGTETKMNGSGNNNNSFKERVEELRRQSEEIDVFSVLEEELRKLI